jgi:MraZ protein
LEQLFIGNERMTIDNKGRVGIPARFMATLRAICPEQSEVVGLMITPDSSIKIMPVPIFEQEIERLSLLNDQIEEERLMINLELSYAELAPLDKQNRIMLNQLMMEECSIKKDVVIIGSRRYLQVFDEKAWHEYRKRGMPRLSNAAAQVVHKNEPKSAIQYVINAGPPEMVAGTMPAR